MDRCAPSISVRTEADLAIGGPSIDVERGARDPMAPAYFASRRSSTGRKGKGSVDGSPSTRGGVLQGLAAAALCEIYDRDPFGTPRSSKFWGQGCPVRYNDYFEVGRLTRFGRKDLCRFVEARKGAVSAPDWLSLSLSLPMKR
jgi:hypothetical protein